MEQEGPRVPLLPSDRNSSRACVWNPATSSSMNMSSVGDNSLKPQILYHYSPAPHRYNSKPLYHFSNAPQRLDSHQSDHPPPAAHQSAHLAGHLSHPHPMSHLSQLPAPPPAHSAVSRDLAATCDPAVSALTRGYNNSSSSRISSSSNSSSRNSISSSGLHKSEPHPPHHLSVLSQHHQSSFAPPQHIYSTIGAYSANGRPVNGLPPPPLSAHLSSTSGVHVNVKSNFMNVDSLISKSSPSSSPLNRGHSESKSRNSSVPLGRTGTEKQAAVATSAPTSSTHLISGQWTTSSSTSSSNSSSVFQSSGLHFAPAIPTTSFLLQPATSDRTTNNKSKDQVDRKRMKGSPAHEQQPHSSHQDNRIFTGSDLTSHTPHNNNKQTPATRHAAIAQVTYAHMFPDTLRPLAAHPHHQHQPHLHHPPPQLLPLHPASHFQPIQSHASHNFQPQHQQPSQTSHPQLVSSHLPQMLPLHPHLPDQRLLISDRQHSSTIAASIHEANRLATVSAAAACDNNNCVPLSLKNNGRSCSRTRDTDHAQHDSTCFRKDVNENSIEIPCSSVSPTNSTTSSSNSNSGGGGTSKYLPKKMWMRKYNEDGPTGLSHPLAVKTPDDQSKENGLIHSHVNSSNSSSSASSNCNIVQHNGSGGNNNNSHDGEASGGCSNNSPTASSADKSKAGKEKVNGASKKKSLPGKKRLKMETTPSPDSEATDSELDDAGQLAKRNNSVRAKKKTSAVKGHKRSVSESDPVRGKKSKKSKAEQESGENLSVDKDGKEKGRKGVKGKKQKQREEASGHKRSEDSDRTEDEADEQKQEEEKSERGDAAASISTASSSSCEPASGSKQQQQKRGRKPKSGSNASGKRSPSNSSIASSNHSVSKKEKSPKSKGNDNNKSKKSKSNSSSCDLSIDKSGKPFLQNKSCSEMSPKSSSQLPKCRECKMTPYQKIKKDVGPSIFCRFYQFRKLVFDKDLRAAGFSDPKDARDEDMKLWMPPDDGYDILKQDDARFLVDFVGDHFCDLVAQEIKAFVLHMGSANNIAWKSVVPGVREMCDVCQTTLFNIHWVCSECGFVVCIDCYRTRREEEREVLAKENQNKQQAMSGSTQNMKSEKCMDDSQSGNDNNTPPASTPTARNQNRDRDRFDWLFCNSKQPHLQEKLMLTQIVSKSALWDVFERLHQVKRRLGCPCKCNIEQAVALLLKKHRNCLDLKSLKEKDLNGCCELQPVVKTEPSETGAVSSSPLTILADAAIKSSDSDQVISDFKKEESGRREEDDEKMSALKDLLSASSPSKQAVEGKGKVSVDHLQQQQSVPHQKDNDVTSVPVGGKKRGKKVPMLATQLNGVIRCSEDAKSEPPLQFFTRRIRPIFTSKNSPPQASCLEETKKLFPDIQHDWYCDGRLLVLKDTGNETPQKYLPLFQQQWLRHQPVVVCKVNEWLERHLWLPSVFKNKFSETKFDLVETETGEVIRDQPLKKYWDGFENLKLRPKDKDGRPLIYKLKDWPPGEEFGDALPEQFNDLMSCIPMPDYTTHEGSRNLVSRLPRSTFLVPDMGPKLYTAYGLASDVKGTTNLHLDISDAVNVMVYVGTFKSKDDEKEHQKNVMKALEEANIDKNQMNRAKKEKVGALWHIYDARDADKIRDLLNCYALEKGRELHLHQDPIHDQSFYLDSNLRRRLKEKYNVFGYTIVQYYGDAVFIPAGAPHQVRNLSSCIKVATDFVSPENVAHCFNLTDEFRQLSQAHDNHEDKLQIKNIIYHAIKDALAAFPEDETCMKPNATTT